MTIYIGTYMFRLFILPINLFSFNKHLRAREAEKQPWIFSWASVFFFKDSGGRV